MKLFLKSTLEKRKFYTSNNIILLNLHVQITSYIEGIMTDALYTRFILEEKQEEYMMWPNTNQQKLMSALLECFINISSIEPSV